MIHIALVDDNPFVTDTLETIISYEDDMKVIAKVNNGRQMLEELHTATPDVVVLDLRMPVLNGQNAAELLFHIRPNTRVLVYSMHHSETLIKQSKENGVHGYLVKGCSNEELITAIRTIYQGQRYYESPEVKSMLNR